MSMTNVWTGHSEEIKKIGTSDGDLVLVKLSRKKITHYTFGVSIIHSFPVNTHPALRWAGAHHRTCHMLDRSPVYYMADSNWQTSTLSFTYTGNLKTPVNLLVLQTTRTLTVQELNPEPFLAWDGSVKLAPAALKYNSRTKSQITNWVKRKQTLLTFRQHLKLAR